MGVRRSSGLAIALAAAVSSCDAPSRAPVPAAPAESTPTPTVPPAPTPTPAPTPAPEDDGFVDAPIDGTARWLAFRDDARLLVAKDRHGAPLGIVELEADTGRELARIEGEGSGPPAAWSSKAGVLAFATETHVVVRTLAGGVADRTLPVTGAGTIAFSPEGDRVVVTRSEPVEIPSASVFDSATGTRLALVRPFGRRKLPYDSGFLMVARFVDRDRIAFLLANDTPPEASLAVWTWATPRRRRSGFSLASVPSDVDVGPAARLGEALAVAADGTIAAGDFDSRVHVARPDATTVETFATGLEVVTALAFAPDGSWLAAVGEGEAIVRLAMPSGSPLGRAPAPEQCGVLAVAPAGDRIAAGCDAVVRVYDVATIGEP